MATAPVKSPLHNFPPTFLKWASKNTNTHHHRCRRYPFDSPPPPPPPPPQPPSTPATDVEVQLENGIEGDNKPWNLRPRRASTCTSISTSSVMESSENLSKSTRLRGIEGHSGGEKRKFWIALSKDEIEEDIYSITGSKPSRRPRKRPRIVQKQLDNVFPGLWLNGLTPEAYRAFDLSSKT